MGLIREPKNVDFYVLDKPWTDKERKEFSEFIKLRKDQIKKKSKKATKTTIQKKVIAKLEISFYSMANEGANTL